jgi:hypothetical protein
MPAAIAIVPASGSVVSVLSACRVTVTGATQNDDTAYTTTAYPQSPELRYYLTFEKGGAILGKSYVFGVNENGDHVFNNYICPSSGSWTVRLSNAATAGSVATAAVTVS